MNMLSVPKHHFSTRLSVPVFYFLVKCFFSDCDADLVLFLMLNLVSINQTLMSPCFISINPTLSDGHMTKMQSEQLRVVCHLMIQTNEDAADWAVTLWAVKPVVEKACQMYCTCGAKQMCAAFLKAIRIRRG